MGPACFRCLELWGVRRAAHVLRQQPAVRLPGVLHRGGRRCCGTKLVRACSFRDAAGCLQLFINYSAVKVSCVLLAKVNQVTTNIMSQAESLKGLGLR